MTDRSLALSQSSSDSALESVPTAGQLERATAMSLSSPSSFPKLLSSDRLAQLITATASVMGADYYPALAEQLTQILDMRYALIGEVCDWDAASGLPTRVRTLCFWAEHGVVDNFEYDLAGTPCGALLRQACDTKGEQPLCWFPSDLQNRFPDDLDLVNLQAESYIGLALIDPDSQGALGHMCLLDPKPISPEKRHAAETLLSLFATRTVAELKRQLAERRERDRVQQLERTLAELQRTQSQLIQSEKISSLGQLVAGVAHEINNPLGCITGNLSHTADYATDLLEHLNLYRQHVCDPPPPLSEHAEDIDLDYLIEDFPLVVDSMKVSVDRIQEIVTSLRQFSRLDADYSLSNLHDGLDSTLTVLRHRLKANSERPEILVIKEYGDLPLISCRPGQLNQVFMNLLGNAIDALEEANPGRSYTEIQTNPNVICIRTQVVSEETGDRVVICIADNGAGIPPAVQPRLFETFFTTKSTKRGTGLGLSLSNQIVTEHHGGRLTFESTPGEGTEFIIELPLQKTSLS